MSSVQLSLATSIIIIILFFENIIIIIKTVGVACNRRFIVANILSVPCHISLFFLALHTSNPSLTAHTHTHTHKRSRCSLVQTSFPLLLAKIYYAMCKTVLNDVIKITYLIDGPIKIYISNKYANTVYL